MMILMEMPGWKITIPQNLVYCSQIQKRERKFADFTVRPTVSSLKEKPQALETI